MLDESINSLGAKIKNYRLEQKITIKTLSQVTGLTSSYLSQLERNMVVPSLKSLVKIGEALGVPIISLFSKNIVEKDPVTKRGQRMHVKLPNSNIEYELLSPSFNHNVLFLLSIIQPHQTREEEFVTHHGEECIYILDGTMVVEIEDKSYTIVSGDSIHFDSGKAHRLLNEGDETVVAIVVESPPSF